MTIPEAMKAAGTVPVVDGTSAVSAITMRGGRMSNADEGNSNIQVEITDINEFHCFKLTFNPRSAPGEKIEIMLHARSLVDLIHKCSIALCDWQHQSSGYLIERLNQMDAL